MSFCMPSDVLAIVDTDMSPAEVDVLIDVISAVMTATMNTGSLNSQLLRGLCQLWVAYRVILKDPDSRRIGEYAEDRATQLKLMKVELDEYKAVVAGGGVSIVMGKDSLA